ncbi:MAG: ribosomal-protein-alanine N-acetyltransferase [Gammaproteobacteria bacterium TMED112]|nr:MAG: ribosomal-protein-alanine N-acetyltransferase [Gammaproteobacteria bacterium TMED112]
MLRKENQISQANNYIIENFSEHHLDDVMEIEVHANPTPWTKQTFEKILELRSQSFVIILNSQIVGFCIANKVLDECHLQNISVADTMRRQGIGNFMLDILKKRMNLAGITVVLLEVRKSNKVAQDFYRENGFQELSIRKDYYQTKNGREDAIIMRLKGP